MRLITLILLLCLATLSAPAQEKTSMSPYTKIDTVALKVTYSLSYLQDTLDPERIRQEDMLLFLGDEVSVFMSFINKLRNDFFRNVTSRSELKAILMEPQRQPPPTRFRYEIFKNYPEGKITTLNSVMGDPFKYYEDLNDFDWELTGEKSTIKGYEVQKATTRYGGRDWVAWFATAIPFNDGPYVFNGLPGLILEIRDTRDHYVFEFISAEVPEETAYVEYQEARKHIETTKKNFFRARQAFYDDIITRAAEAGMSSHTQQVAARNLRRRNNPLELIAE